MYGRRGLWKMWESRASLARLFQAAVGIRIKKKAPKASDDDADFQSCGIFHKPFFFLVLFLFVTGFPLWKTGWVALRISHPTGLDGCRRLSSAIETGSETYAQMMSLEDSTIRIMDTSCRYGWSWGNEGEVL
jgi:hypothetical protein